MYTGGMIYDYTTYATDMTEIAVLVDRIRNEDRQRVVLNHNWDLTYVERSTSWTDDTGNERHAIALPGRAVYIGSTPSRRRTSGTTTATGTSESRPLRITATATTPPWTNSGAPKPMGTSMGAGRTRRSTRSAPISGSLWPQGRPM